ncbi:armadillo-type protein [Dichotomocladium elegans]|nr:armadillo-type protein [Dichotomocladium elegans]
MTILEFLTLVPEEIANAEITSTRKPQITQELKDSISLVLATLSSALIDDRIGYTSQQRSLHALQSWIQYGIELEIIYPLLHQCMLFLGNEQLFSSATDVLLEAMQQPSYLKYETFRNDLLNCLTSDGMKAKFIQCIEDGNDDEGALIAKLVTGFGEAFTDFVAAQLADVKVKLLLDMMMQLTDFPGSFPGDQEVSDIPLNFWYMLQETLFDEGIVPVRGEQQRTWIRQCGETGLLLYRRLVIVLKKKSMFPDDCTWNSWQKDIIVLLNRWHMEPSVSRELEAALFTLKSISEEIPSNEPESIRRFFGPEILERFPRDADIRLQYTMILVIGSLAEWLKVHPDYLPAVMNYLVPCLSIPRLSLPAASSFSDICDTCRESLTSELDNLMHVYNSMANSVVESVAGVIQVLPPEAAISPLMALIGDILQGVGKALSTANQNPEAGRRYILVQLNYLSACCRGIQSPNDDYQSLSARNNMYDFFASGHLAAIYINVDGVREIISAIREFTQRIVTYWQADEEVMKAVSVFIESGIRSTSPLLTLQFDELTTLVTTCYSVAPFACWLHTSALIMTVYGGAQDNHIRLRDMLGALTEKTLSFISRTEGKRTG